MEVKVPSIAPFLPDPIRFSSPQYLLLQKLGNGSFGVAYIAVLASDCNLVNGVPLPSCEMLSKMSQLYVVKRFRNELDDAESEGKNEEERKAIIARKRQMFAEERRLAGFIQSDSSEFLLRYHHDVPDRESGTDAMVFFFCNRGDIRRLISGLKDERGELIHLTLYEILRVGVQLSGGLSHLHKRKIIHRDLALRNLFVHLEEGELNFKIGGVISRHSHCSSVCVRRLRSLCLHR